MITLAQIRVALGDDFVPGAEYKVIENGSRHARYPFDGTYEAVGEMGCRNGTPRTYRILMRTDTLPAREEARDADTESEDRSEPEASGGGAAASAGGSGPPPGDGDGAASGAVHAGAEAAGPAGLRPRPEARPVKAGGPEEEPAA